MKAAVIREHGGPEVIRIEDVPAPKPGPQDVVVAVRAGALNHLDVWVRRGGRAELKFPHVIGADGAGVVAAVGRDVQGVEVGLEVVVVAGLSCGVCEFCRAGEQSLCPNFGIVGSPTHSGTGALHAYINGATYNWAQFNLVYSSAQDLSGYTISAWIWVDASLGGTTQIQAFLIPWTSGGWTTFSTTNANVGKWVKVSYSPGGSQTGITQFGFQFYTITAGASGNIYIDDVTLSGPPPAACRVLFNSFETLGENGTLQTLANSTYSLSTAHATQGTHSLDINVTTAAPGWNDKIFKLSGFSPANWSGSYTYMMADLYADASMIAGSSYTKMLLYGDTATSGGQISSNAPTLITGQQTLVWALDSLPTGGPVTDIYFIYNADPTVGTGNFYLDNVRLANMTCP